VDAVSNLNDVLAVRRAKNSTMEWRKSINDVLSVGTEAFDEPAWNQGTIPPQV
jgi:hypothetical protein